MTLNNPHYILSPGTQIVTATDITQPDGSIAVIRGAVGVVIKSPSDHRHAYRIRLIDGTEVSLKRHEIAIKKHYQNPRDPNGNETDQHADLYDYVIYRCVVGSRAYGLDSADSDTDLRGFYLPPTARYWSIYGVPEQLVNEEREECYWEIQKFIMLALKANPNILECLYTPLVEHVTPLAQELLDLREIFVSKMIYQTYNGYVMSQFKKLNKHLEKHGSIRWKHAMHLIRLLISGIDGLETGVIPVQVPDAYRDQLLAIRDGKTPWEEVNQWRLDLHHDFDAAFNASQLPDRPDYERANEFLIAARRAALEG
ncbi:MAG: nucleotidyltransferase domain-containing protein [Anaerolineae bacterium]|nr:nucleotidyltransferase domain-containing protein [Anaerolineae bacterium]